MRQPAQKVQKAQKAQKAQKHTARRRTIHWGLFQRARAVRSLAGRRPRLVSIAAQPIQTSCGQPGFRQRQQTGQSPLSDATAVSRAAATACSRDLYEAEKCARRDAPGDEMQEPFERAAGLREWQAVYAVAGERLTGQNGLPSAPRAAALPRCWMGEPMSAPLGSSSVCCHCIALDVHPFPCPSV